MSERFGVGAARLAGMAGVTLGWRPHDFWRATPAELAGALTALLPPGEQGLQAGDLCKLMEQFPDG